MQPENVDTLKRGSFVSRKRRRSEHTHSSVTEADVNDVDGHEMFLFRLVGLVEQEAGHSSVSFRFGVKGLRVGRDAGCSDALLSGPGISRLHCILSVMGKREVCVHDKSSNGTFINGKKVGRGRCSMLGDGDVLSFVNPTLPDSAHFSFKFELIQENVVPTPFWFTALADFLKPFQLGPSIGQGSFALVRLGVRRSTGDLVAIKVVEKNKFISEPILHAMRNEVEITRRLNHPHFVKTIAAIETVEATAVVMEYIRGGDLFDYIVGRGCKPFTEEEARFLFVQVLEALAYLHANRIVHCDVKPENILVEAVNATQSPTVEGADILLSVTDDHKEDAQRVAPMNVCLKLTDFGSARYEGELCSDEEDLTPVGTPAYAAPELLQGTPGCEPISEEALRQGIGPAVDLWSLGVLLYIFCSGTLPKRTVQGAKLQFNGSAANLSDECKDLIQQMLMIDPRERIDLPGIVAHRWLTGCSMNIQLSAEDSLSTTMPSPMPTKGSRLASMSP
ncbi:serine/threonine-protein kinase Chk2 [Strigomonas culicis]|uniref:Serine/threonine-protein kinase Chk2 n=1 Tax=Strigomonas culicis TaxID=28005 RepID=S9UTG5_9TRYP|nr:serine/threonine-protein kinase Chk2 [Strigomonas culicis]EPY34242.1 serine/threonine-protein kinase Chk2 [Strigomonas culicis]EPY35150.1 serine/threonine-protein kinase Chk2 [Strigomonas culicis]|eukprot:EPY32090.1 serine/threonine-protein kinase Chk2 [Strigomonas culicis]